MKRCCKRLRVVLVLFVLALALSACDNKANPRSQTSVNTGARTTIAGMPTITPRNQRQGSVNTKPWENGGKAINEYTWAEFEALSPGQQEMFFDAFVSIDAFESWRRVASASTGSGTVEPWRNGGKAVSEYTWAEFEALSPELQELFFDAFGSINAFETWRKTASTVTENLIVEPWKNGGKSIYEYTWAEFEALSPELQELFFDAFGSVEAFSSWMNKVQE